MPVAYDTITYAVCFCDNLDRICHETGCILSANVILVRHCILSARIVRQPLDEENCKANLWPKCSGCHESTKLSQCAGRLTSTKFLRRYPSYNNFQNHWIRCFYVSVLIVPSVTINIIIGKGVSFHIQVTFMHDSRIVVTRVSPINCMLSGWVLTNVVVNHTPSLESGCEMRNNGVLGWERAC